jgi:hypothetical protein
MAVLAHVCSYLHDRERAATMYDLVAPFSNRIGVMSFSQGCTGSMHHSLALLSGTIGDHNRAAFHAECAIEVNRKLGATPWIALCELALARSFGASKRPADRNRARALLESAHTTASELGMQSTAQRCSEALQS